MKMNLRKYKKIVFWKYNKNRNRNNAIFTDEFCIYLRSPEISRWVTPN